jgi:hypothetical protein
VRALVLDGALDPSVPVLTGLDEQSASLDAQLQQFFAYCARSSTCPWDPPGGDRTSAFEALLARLRSSPLQVKGTNRTVGPAELFLGTAAALYTPASWEYLGDALAKAQSGNGAEMLGLFDSYTRRNANGTYGNVFEANAAVTCVDRPAPSIASIEAAVPEAELGAPVFGVMNIYDEIVCDEWPVASTGKVGPLRAPGAPPIVVIGSTGDPVTPYSWAQGLASQLGSGVLLTRVGDGHTGYVFSSCVRRIVDAYLVKLVPPAPGTSCPSD